MARSFAALLLGVGVSVCLLCQSAMAGNVTLTKSPNSVCVRIDGEVFTVLHTSPDWPKPFFNPVTAAGGIEQLAQDVKEPSGQSGLPGSRVIVCREDAQLRVLDITKSGLVKLGEVIEVREVKRPWLWVPEKNGWINEADVAPLGSSVTRVIQTHPTAGLAKDDPLYYDHPHHKGVWLSVDEVNEIKYWAEKGIIRNVSVTIDKAQGEWADMTIVNHWLDTDESPLLQETTRVRILADRTMAFDIELAAVRKPVTFADTKEGLFGIRLPNSMRENSGGGPVENAEGLKTTAHCWGQTSAWVDYAGPVGKRNLAVTLFDHPSSFRKSRYHVRDYGLFTLSPFGEKSYTNGAQPAAHVQLEPGKSIRLSYGLNVRDNTSNTQGAAEAYRRFAELPR